MEAKNNTQSGQRCHLLHNNRRQFYRQHVFSTSQSASCTSVVWDESIGEDVTDPEQVKSVLLREASLQLCRKTLPPENPEEWFTKGYDPRSLAIPSRVWDPLCAPFSVDELCQSARGPADHLPRGPYPAGGATTAECKHRRPACRQSRALAESAPMRLAEWARQR